MVPTEQTTYGAQQRPREGRGCEVDMAKVVDRAEKNYRRPSRVEPDRRDSLLLPEEGSRKAVGAVPSRPIAEPTLLHVIEVKTVVCARHNERSTSCLFLAPSLPRPLPLPFPLSLSSRRLGLVGGGGALALRPGPETHRCESQRSVRRTEGRQPALLHHSVEIEDNDASCAGSGSAQELPVRAECELGDRTVARPSERTLC